MARWLVAAVLVAGLSGCSDENRSGNGPGPAAGKYSYQLTEDGCSTGYREFPTLEALCDALQSRRENNGCRAPTQRPARFKELGCPGTYQERP